MRTRIAGDVLAVILAATVTSTTVAAQGFEGVVRQRTIEVGQDALWEIVYALEDETPDDAGTELDEDEYLRAAAERILGLSMDRLLSMEELGIELEVSESTLYVKDNRIRADADGMGYFLMDLDSESMQMVVPARRVYAEWTAEELARQQAEMMASLGMSLEDLRSPAGEPVEAAPRSMSPLGRSREINGVEATGYRAESANAIAEGWIAPADAGLATAFQTFAERMASFSDMGPDMDEGPSLEDGFWERGLPVRVQVVSTAYESLSGYSVEDLLSMERRDVSADLFRIPDDYQKTSLAELWR